MPKKSKRKHFAKKIDEENSWSETTATNHNYFPRGRKEVKKVNMKQKTKTTSGGLKLYSILNILTIFASRDVGCTKAP